MTRHYPFLYLDAKEQEEFKKRARTDYEPFTPIDGIWHPIYQAECALINHELAIYTVDQNEPGSLDVIEMSNDT